MSHLALSVFHGNSCMAHTVISLNCWQQHERKLEHCHVLLSKPKLIHLCKNLHKNESAEPSECYFNKCKGQRRKSKNRMFLCSLSFLSTEWSHRAINMLGLIPKLKHMVTFLDGTLTCEMKRPLNLGTHT